MRRLLPLVLFVTTLVMVSSATADAGTARPAGAASACTGSELVLSRGTLVGYEGHGGVLIRFRNRSRHACRLHGYPTLAAITSSGHVLARAKDTVRGYLGGSRKGVQSITLRPGRHASSLAEWNLSEPGGASCPLSASVEFTPPNSTKSSRKPAPASRCELRVHPVVHGTQGGFDR